MKMTTFQMITLIAFGMFMVLGIAIFSVFGGIAGNNGVGVVLVWGTADQQTMETLLAQLKSQNKTFRDVTYVQKSPTTYTSDLINAMASGAGPDLFLVTQDNIQSFANKVLPIPYNSVSQSAYTTAFIDEGQLFLTPTGSLALPFMVDPLVMYWNKNLFATAGVATPPQYWNGFLDLAPKITSIDAGSNVQQSAVALGEWQNIVHAKEILSTLFMQAGDSIVLRAADGSAQAVFGQTPANQASNPSQSALLFYTEFANPTKTTYSWNRSLLKSRDLFVAGNLAVYFGFSSEYKDIAAANPNLSFAVAMAPQIQGSTVHMTFGQLTGVAIARTARNAPGALLVAQGLVSQVSQQALALQTGMPSVRRDVALDTSANAATQVFAQSALITRGWLDPDSAQTDAMFKSMIESVLSGKADPAGAVAQSAQQMGLLTRQLQQ
jgi:ABC-type glycerol-3-phosphate transport system substrate-binding protein